jgi:hypothetical protein
LAATVRRAAHALAANASAHGAGRSKAVRRLSADANRLRALLEDAEIRRAFGARDMWQLIERIATDQLGRRANVRRLRTLAQSGSTILQWLVEHVAAPGANDTPLPDPALADAAQAWLNAAPADDPPAGRPGGSDLLSLARRLRRLVGWPAAAPGGHGGLTLFCGAAGSGKTLGAHALATALSRELVRADLRQVVSKNIGETEKNLAALLERVERADAVLLLDEADALFGRRTDVQGAHDRYDASTIDAVLHRLRAHRGMVIVESTVLPQDAGGAAARSVRFPPVR